MEPITLTWAAEVLGARVIGAAGDVATDICTDTRQGAAGALFFALQGENADGHRYVAQAFAAGAVGAVVSREIEGVPGPLLVVPDTLRALGDLAMHYRRRFPIPVIGVTGSVGKTSTKEMIAAVLRTRYHTLANEKNLNNEIGVPLTLFQLTKTHEVAVIEMGMRGLGEIDRLAEIAQPNVGVITNIGYAHAERLGSREAIAQAKSELLARLPEGGVAILPWWDDFFEYLYSRVPDGCRLVRFATDPRTDSEVRVVEYEPVYKGGATHFPVSIGGTKQEVVLRVVGAHHVPNALAALAVGYALGVPPSQAVDALGQWEGAEGRMVIRRTTDGLTILDDCYNAGPESMEAALNTLGQMTDYMSGTCLNGAAVLGDMRELGQYAVEAHRFVGKRIAEMEVLCLVTVGELAKWIGEEAVRHATSMGWNSIPGVRHFATTEECVAQIEQVKEMISPGDVILVKGSRAMEMEKIVAALVGEAGGNG